MRGERHHEVGVLEGVYAMRFMYQEGILQLRAGGISAQWDYPASV